MVRLPDAPALWQEGSCKIRPILGGSVYQTELPGLGRYAEPALTGAGFRFSACHSRRPAPSLKIARRATGVTLYVHRIQMSLFLPFRNVTVAGFGRRVGAEPVRSAAPARRAALECACARSTCRETQPTLNSRASL